MPLIVCHIAEGLKPDQKSALVRRIVEVTHEAVGSDPKIINVLLSEHPPEAMSVSGRVAPGAGGHTPPS